jgi:hypothetical protein
MSKLALLALAVQLAACGNDHTNGDDDGAPDAPPSTDGFRTLVSGSWSLAPASEKYVCVRLTVAADTYVKAIRPIAPTGTHHTVMMIGAPDQADGTIDCDSSITRPALYASGVGTQPLDMPAGVAIHMRPGQQLLLNLHLFNASDAQLDGVSGIEILESEPVDAQHEAGVVLIGKAFGLLVPPGNSTSVGRCTTPAGITVFAVGPHMHMLGTHMKVSYAEAGGANPRVLHDDDYSFDAQRYHVLDPHLLTTAGGRVTVECSYFNGSGATVPFGESSTDEMCYALTFAVPAPTVEQCLQ